MEKDVYVERLLETENLTDELEDREANWLLEWGIARLGPALETIEEEEAAGNKVNALMAVMRKINRLAGSRARRTSEELSAELIVLLQLFEAAFGQARQASPDEIEAAAASLPGLSTQQALELLANWGSK
jgi:hypothetical protein